MTWNLLIKTQNHHKNRKMIVIITVYYVVTCLAASIFGSLQPVTHIPEVVLQITQFGPTLGVLAVWLLFRKRNALPMATGLSFRRDILRRIFGAMALTLLIFAISLLVFRLFGKDAQYVSPASLRQPFWLIVGAQLVGAAGEEFGWRCFLQSYLQTKFSVVSSSTIVGLLWGMWHIGIFAEGLVFAGAFIVFTVALSIAMGELLRGARGNNLVVATVFHAAVNLGLLLLFNEESGSVFAALTIAAACGLVAVGAVVYNKRQRNMPRMVAA